MLNPRKRNATSSPQFRSSDISPNGGSLIFLPPEIWLEILEVLLTLAHNSSVRAGILNVLLTCRYLHHVTSEYLYRNVRLSVVELHREDRDIDTLAQIPSSIRSAKLLDTLFANAAYRSLVKHLHISGTGYARYHTKTYDLRDVAIMDRLAGLLTQLTRLTQLQFVEVRLPPKMQTAVLMHVSVTSLSFESCSQRVPVSYEKENGGTSIQTKDPGPAVLPDRITDFSCNLCVPSQMACPFVGPDIRVLRTGSAFICAALLSQANPTALHTLDITRWERDIISITDEANLDLRLLETLHQCPQLRILLLGQPWTQSSKLSASAIPELHTFRGHATDVIYIVPGRPVETVTIHGALSVYQETYKTGQQLRAALDSLPSATKDVRSLSLSCAANDGILSRIATLCPELYKLSIRSPHEFDNFVFIHSSNTEIRSLLLSLMNLQDLTLCEQIFSEPPKYTWEADVINEYTRYAPRLQMVSLSAGTVWHRFGHQEWKPSPPRVLQNVHGGRKEEKDAVPRKKGKETFGTISGDLRHSLSRFFGFRKAETEYVPPPPARKRGWRVVVRSSIGRS